MRIWISGAVSGMLAACASAGAFGAQGPNLLEDPSSHASGPPVKRITSWEDKNP